MLGRAQPQKSFGDEALDTFVLLSLDFRQLQ